MDYLAYFSAGLTVVGGVVWLVRLEGRVNGHDSKVNNFDKRFDRLEEKLDKLIDFLLRQNDAN